MGKQPIIGVAKLKQFHRGDCGQQSNVTVGNKSASQTPGTFTSKGHKVFWLKISPHERDGATRDDPSLVVPGHCPRVSTFASEDLIYEW